MYVKKKNCSEVKFNLTFIDLLVLIGSVKVITTDSGYVVLFFLCNSCLDYFAKCLFVIFLIIFALN